MKDNTFATRGGSCRRQVLLLFIYVIVGMSEMSGQSQISLLEIDDVKSSDITAHFDVQCADSNPPANVDKMSRVTGRKGKFALHLDPNISRPQRTGQSFEYVFYLEELNPSQFNRQPNWHRCSALALPLGAFLDRSVPLSFTIRNHGVVDGNSIEVPIHSIANLQFISVSTTEVPAKVDLTSSAHIGAHQPGVQLQIKNNLSDMDVVIDGTANVSTGHSDYWSGVGVRNLGDGKPFSIGPGQQRSVQLDIEPNRLPALLSTLAAVKADAQHDRLDLEINYESDFGGANRLIPVPVPVRFVPSLPSLIIALIAGSILGTLSGQLLPNAWKGSLPLLGKVGRGLLFSVIAELFAMLLVALGSKFVILQFELDPWQFLPVLFIGFIVSGGKEVLNYMGLGGQTNSSAPPPTGSNTEDRTTPEVSTSPASPA